jgi:hypothetical protein
MIDVDNVALSLQAHAHQPGASESTNVDERRVGLYSEWPLLRVAPTSHESGDEETTHSPRAKRQPNRLLIQWSFTTRHVSEG